METFSALLDLCAGNSSVTGEFSAKRPVTRSFDVFRDLRLNKWLSKQSGGWWFETPSRPLWRHCNGVINWHKQPYVCREISPARPTLNRRCNYLSMSGLKLNHASKREPWRGIYESVIQTIIGSDMACHLFSTKPSPEPMFTYSLEQTKVKFESEYGYFLSWKCHLKRRLQNGDHFVAASMC